MMLQLNEVVNGLRQCRSPSGQVLGLGEPLGQFFKSLALSWPWNSSCYKQTINAVISSNSKSH